MYWIEKAWLCNKCIELKSIFGETPKAT